MRLIVCLLALFALALPLRAQTAFEWQPRARVVFVGDGLIEEAQRYGYFELAMTTRWPEHDLSFRNVGWAGDTVWGEARDHYTNPPTAYAHLIEQITTARPSVVVLGYGGGLAFEEETAIPAFADGLNALLDDLEPTGARCILLSPIPHEPRRSPTPSVAVLNERLARTRDTIEALAHQRTCAFVDLYTGLADAYEQASAPLTTDGVHLNTEGYRHAATLLLAALHPPPLPRLTVDVRTGQVEGARLVGPLHAAQFSLVFPVLAWHPEAPWILALEGLEAGTHTLHADRQPVATATAREWARGVRLDLPLERQQVEALHKAILEKNALYFRQYRPQNETYLVGFRRYEQGQNAAELDQLNPLIDALENDIGRLRMPHPVVFEIR